MLISQSTMDEQKIIRIREYREGKFPHYLDDYFVKSGTNVTVTYPDGKSYTMPVKFIDAYHFQLGFEVYHIDQFAEILYHNHASSKPEAYLTDPAVYTKKYYDRDLEGADGNLIPYKEFICYHNPMDYHGIPALSVAFCAEAAPERQFCLAWAVNGTASQPAAEKRFCSAKDVEQTLIDILPSTLAIDDFRDQDRKLLEAFVQDNCQTKNRSLDAMVKDASGRQQSQSGRKEPAQSVERE